MVQDKKRFSPLRFYSINLIFLVLILFAGFLVFLIATCTVNTVTVKGATFYSSKEIEDKVLNDRYKTNGAWDVLKNRIRPRKDIPFVEKVNVSLSHFHDLTITVEEKDIVGFIQGKDNNLIYLDRNGVVTDISRTQLPNMIPVTGLDTKKTVTEGKRYPAAENRVSALSTLFHSKDNMNLDLDEVTFGDSGQITLECGNVTVALGTAESLKDKLIRLSYILPKVKNQAGTLHFENYSSDNTDVVFDAQEEK